MLAADLALFDCGVDGDDDALFDLVLVVAGGGVDGCDGVCSACSEF